MNCHFDCRTFDSLQKLLDWRKELKLQNRTLALATGCFDILHNGHCSYLRDASSYADYLLVGLNDDKSIKALKGENRPINNQKDRSELIGSLRFVNAVFVYENTAQFLKNIKPDIWVKGSDYNLKTLNQEELSHIVEGGGKVVFSPLKAGLSSSALLSKI